jgi:tetratricopeptide (TPR) repeat protein
MIRKGIYFLLAIFLIGCGAPKEETSEFQGTVEKRDYTAEGYEYLKKSDIPKAIQSFDQAIKQDPRNAKNFLVLGEVYLRLKNFTSAEDTFIGATRVEPNNPEGYYFLALSRAPQPDKRELTIESAKQAAELFMAQRNEEGFKRAMLVLKGIEQPTATSSAQTPANP